ncbi:MAG: acyl-CoA dehydrogenase family protein [Acidimicrobiales bacterium]
MDFSLSDEQSAVVEAVAPIFAAAAESEDATRCWAALSDANLLGLAVDTGYGGSGLGFFEISLLLEEAGRVASPTPLWPTLVLGGLALGHFGSDAQKDRWLPSLAAGRLIATAALLEPGTEADRPGTLARADGEGWLLDGFKTTVPALPLAGLVLVPVRVDGGGSAVFIVDPAAAGVTVGELDTTTGWPQGRLDLEAVSVGPDQLLGEIGQGEEILEWLVPRAVSGLCSFASGVCDAAVRLTAEYVASRQQFGRAIATFQAVGQRAADAYIDAEAVRLTARQAAWRLSAGLAAQEEVAIAKFWAAEGGQRVVHAAVHLHGGVGVDRSYPLHRYFLAAKQLELQLGGATVSLARLGRAMAARRP